MELRIHWILPKCREVALQTAGAALKRFVQVQVARIRSSSAEPESPDIPRPSSRYRVQRRRISPSVCSVMRKLHNVTYPPDPIRSQSLHRFEPRTKSRVGDNYRIASPWYHRIQPPPSTSDA